MDVRSRSLPLLWVLLESLPISFARSGPVLRVRAAGQRGFRNSFRCCAKSAAQKPHSQPPPPGDRPTGLVEALRARTPFGGGTCGLGCEFTPRPLRHAAACAGAGLARHRVPRPSAAWPSPAPAPTPTARPWEGAPPPGRLSPIAKGAACPFFSLFSIDSCYRLYHRL